MKKGVIGKAIVLAAILGLLGGRAAFAQVDEGDMATGGALDLAIGNLIATVGTDEQFADADLSTLMPAGDPNSGRGSAHYEVDNAHRADRGSCNNTWANDTFDVTFHVKRDDEGPGNYTLVEQFKNGTFTTTGVDPSPGSCNNGQPNTFGHLGPGVNGKDHGYATFAVSCNDPLNPNCFNPNANQGQGCNPTATNPNPCGGTAAFCMTFFGPTATCTRTAYSFDYRSNNPTLIKHHWRDAFKNGQLHQQGDICQANCGQGEGEDGHGNGEVQGRGVEHASFQSEEDGPKYGHQSAGERYSDPNTGESFNSTQVDAVDFNDLTRVITITGSGVNQNGTVVTFTIVETAATLTAPALYSITLSDGYTNSGALLAGALSAF